MECSVKSGILTKMRTACLVLGVYAGKKLSVAALLVDEASDHFITLALKKGDLDGKLGQTLLLYQVPGLPAERVLLVGLGKESEFNEKTYLEVITQSTLAVKALGAQDAISTLAEALFEGRDTYWRIRLGVMATHDALYQFDGFRSKKEVPAKMLRRIVFTITNRRELSIAEKAVQEAAAIAQGMTFTKNLANTPPNICTPTFLAEQAEKLCKKSEALSIAVLEEAQIKALGMGAFMAVAQGSSTPPKFITIEYRGAKKDAKPYVFIGKGITFDTGGYSLKDKVNIVGQKYDMSGAATVLGVLQAVNQLALPLNVVGVIPTCENMINGQATRPEDIITTLLGTTVEILNTDAEGRLILCDALTYSERFSPEVVIDIATLTGACIIALGRHATGLFTNHAPLGEALYKAGLETHDRAWPMPLWEEYHSQLRSTFADMSNTGGPEAGSITAASFLSQFAKKFHWAHLDIAGTATKASEKAATGRPVPLLVQYLLNVLAPSKKSK